MWRRIRLLPITNSPTGTFGHQLHLKTCTLLVPQSQTYWLKRYFGLVRINLQWLHSLSRTAWSDQSCHTSNMLVAGNNNQVVLSLNLEAFENGDEVFSLTSSQPPLLTCIKCRDTYSLAILHQVYAQVLLNCIVRYLVHCYTRPSPVKGISMDYENLCNLVKCWNVNKSSNKGSGISHME